jgi:hypothetical protein
MSWRCSSGCDDLLRLTRLFISHHRRRQFVARRVRHRRAPWFSAARIAYNRARITIWRTLSHSCTSTHGTSCHTQSQAQYRYRGVRPGGRCCRKPRMEKPSATWCRLSARSNGRRRSCRMRQNCMSRSLSRSSQSCRRIQCPMSRYNCSSSRCLSTRAVTCARQHHCGHQRRCTPSRHQRRPDWSPRRCQSSCPTRRRLRSHIPSHRSDSALARAAKGDRRIKIIAAPVVSLDKGFGKRGDPTTRTES